MMGLHRVHRGVYAVGHRGLEKEGHWIAAVLACGNGVPRPEATILAAWGAALGHRSAAELWELLAPREGRIQIIRRGDGGRRPRAGIQIHRSRTLADVDVTLRHGVPVTTPVRTIADLPNTVSARLVRRATREAEIRGLLRGSGTATDRTRSDLERDFLRFCRSHGLPAPEVNVRVGRWTVDFLWRARRLVVETDSHTYHRGSVAFEDDHQRDLQLRRHGYDVHRYTGAQLRSSPAEIAAELGECLVELRHARRRP
jgi:very-short-patch-repair endonuclease